MSRPKYLPPDYEDARSRHKATAAGPLLRRARDVGRFHGKDVLDGDGSAFRREAKEKDYRVKASSFTDRDGSAVFEAIVLHDGRILLHGRLVQADGDGPPTVKIEKLIPGLWQAIFFSVFPIYLDQKQ